MKTELTLVINRLGRPLSPTRRTDMIRKKIKRGLARHIGWLHNGIRIVQFLEEKYDNRVVTDHFGIAIDPGYKHIGWSVYKLQDKKLIVLFLGTLELDTPNVTERMKERAMYRILRRRFRRLKALRKFGKAKRRIPRWKNRKRTEKWLTPTGTYLVRNHVNLVKMFKKWLPIQEVCIEYAMFDTQEIQNPNIHGWQYQFGPTKGFERIRQYVLYRDKYRCQICGVENVPLQVHHIVPRSQGGTDRPNNLITLCKQCHQKVHNGEVKCPTNVTNQSLRSTGLLNSCMKRIVEEIATEVNSIRWTTGFDTKMFRRQHDLPKRHDLDSYIIAYNCIEPETNDLLYRESVTLVKYRRHPTRAATARVEDRKYYEIGSNKCIARNRRKRSGQVHDSLQEYLKKNRSHPPLRVVPGRIVRRVDWTKRKRVFRNEIPRFIVKGALIEYIENNRRKYGVVKLFAPSISKITLETGKEIKLRQFSRVLKFGGILPVF